MTFNNEARNARIRADYNVHGLSVDEIAAQYRLSVHTVSSLLYLIGARTVRPRRAISDEQRAELIRLYEAVPLRDGRDGGRRHVSSTEQGRALCEYIARLRDVECVGVYEVAPELGLTPVAVYTWLRKYGLSKTSGSPANDH